MRDGGRRTTDGGRWTTAVRRPSPHHRASYAGQIDAAEVGDDEAEDGGVIGGRGEQAGERIEVLIGKEEPGALWGQLEQPGALAG